VVSVVVVVVVIVGRTGGLLYMYTYAYSGGGDFGKNESTATIVSV
jgi:hypothetical protein